MIFSGCSTRFAEGQVSKSPIYRDLPECRVAKESSALNYVQPLAQVATTVAHIAPLAEAVPAVAPLAHKVDSAANQVSKVARRLTEAQAQFNKQVASIRKKAQPYWGKKAEVPSRYSYVRYEKDFKARSIINFETQEVTIETTDTSNPIRTLQEVIASSLLSPENPEDVDIFSSRNTTHVGVPFLYKRVKDQDNRAIRWEWRANRYAKYLIENSLKKENIKVDGTRKVKYYVKFKMEQSRYVKPSSSEPLISDADLETSSSDTNYASIVHKQANRFGLEPALIFALIETESHFNPFATSAIPAYGLMQVVPTSAGRDAWEFLYSARGQPTREYLFNAKKNIEMGSVYMHILQKRYLAKVTNPKNLELCAIAAYNTGSGNVLRSFHSSRNEAFNMINRLSPDALYAHLRKKLPYKETRDYIKKVTEAKERYL